MKLDLNQANHIKNSFAKMNSKEDLLHLMNEVKPLVYGKKSIPFELKQLTWYSNPKLAKKRYSQFTIKKKSGSDRIINAPVNGLKAIQKVLSVILQCVFCPHDATFGFVNEKSIVDNANVHVGNMYVYNIDLKDFFSSVDQARVWKCLQLYPFNLKGSFTLEKKIEIIASKGIYSFGKIEKVINEISDVQVSFDEFLNKYVSFSKDTNVVRNNYVIGKKEADNPFFTIKRVSNKLEDLEQYIVETVKAKRYGRIEIANIIAAICCAELEVDRLNSEGNWEMQKRNVLPQGAPTSPILTNVICQRLDFLLSAVAKRFGLNYSRYADDITFSSMHNTYQSNSEFLKELHRIIVSQGFHIKESKTRLQKEGFRKEVTGLLVNDKANVQKRYIKQLRMWLYYWESYGYERANVYFTQQYLKDKGNIANDRPDMSNVLDGKLNYLKMVKGAENDLYLKLRERFNSLTQKYNFIEKVIKLWETQGVENAMNFYYQEQQENMIAQDNSVSNDFIDKLAKISKGKKKIFNYET